MEHHYSLLALLYVDTQPHIRWNDFYTRSRCGTYEQGEACNVHIYICEMDNSTKLDIHCINLYAYLKAPHPNAPRFVITTMHKVIGLDIDLS